MINSASSLKDFCFSLAFANSQNLRCFWSHRVTHNCGVTLSQKFKWMSGTSFFWYVNLLRAVSLCLREGWLLPFPLFHSQAGNIKGRICLWWTGSFLKWSITGCWMGGIRIRTSDVTRQTRTSSSSCLDVSRGESQESRQYHCFLKRGENSPGSRRVEGQWWRAGEWLLSQLVLNHVLYWSSYLF